MKRIVVAITLVLLSVSISDARPRNIVAHDDCGISMPCEGVVPSPRGEAIAKAMRFGRARNVYSGTVVSHPAGCPSRAFCGCGASVEVFGKPVRELFLARNWFKFPRTSPASGMVAVRRGHVFVLRQHIEGSTWLVYDANSGGRQTRVHHRSIAGLTIVNPHAQLASLK